MGVSDSRCDQCGKQPASVRFTQVDSGHVRKGHLCAACARARGLLEIAAPQGSKTLVCGECGLAFGDFQQQGRLGCPACYTAFLSELLPLLRQIHGQVEHTGRASGPRRRAATPERKLERLRAALESAVRAEDYERAATLRDEIRALEQAPDEPDTPRGKSPPQETR